MPKDQTEQHAQEGEHGEMDGVRVSGTLLTRYIHFVFFIQFSYCQTSPSLKVIGNMVRLVTEAGDVAPFIPMLLPALKRAAEETVDTEAAEASKSAIDALTKALGVGHVADRAKAGLTGQWEGKEAKMVRIGLDGIY